MEWEGDKGPPYKFGMGPRRLNPALCKKQMNLPKTEGKICKSRGEKNNFRETEGKCTETAKIGGKLEICGRCLKKVIRIFCG